MTAGSVNVISRGADDFLIGAKRRCVELHAVGTLDELRSVLVTMLDRPPDRPRTLDLIGHSTRAGHLLRLGTATIDMFEPAVERFFAGLADEQLLIRLDLVALRLLGCETAIEPSGQRTIRRLARTLRVPVFGTKKILTKSHYDVDGFDPTFRHLLIESARLPDPPCRLPT